jgi:succinate-semialdehyde dehydrogenase/glutarate-semialdehyde dehydrogenase
MIDLSRNDLMPNSAYINGCWVKSSSNEFIEVVNPSNQAVIGSIPNFTEGEIIESIDHAYHAFITWKNTTAKQRNIILKRWYELVIAHKADLAKIMTAEQGKPLKESFIEIEYAASFIEWFAEEAKRVYGDVIASPHYHQRIIVTREPLGVVGAITPWNFPSSMITRKAAAALAAGCTIVIKPSELTPYSALALAKLSEEAGIPQGVLNVVTGKAKLIGETFTSHPKLAKLSFTGSTAVGKILASAASKNVKKLALELGGNAPFIIFEDADIEKAVNSLIACKFRNNGQTCIAANRVLIAEQVYDKALALIKQNVTNLIVGDGFNPSSTLGPVISTAVITRLLSLIEDAKSKGANVLLGGYVIRDLFFAPTIITEVTSDMRLYNEEIFGPILAIKKFHSEEEAIEEANNTRYGLAVYFHSKDINRCSRVTESLQYGMVGINESMISNEVAPFGGIKESGFGREGSYLGIEEFMNVKYCCYGVSER